MDEPTTFSAVKPFRRENREYPAARNSATMEARSSEDIIGVAFPGLRTEEVVCEEYLISSPW